jgi:hypothetical protein
MTKGGRSLVCIVRIKRTSRDYSIRSVYVNHHKRMMPEYCNKTNVSIFYMISLLFVDNPQFMSTKM